MLKLEKTGLGSDPRKYQRNQTEIKKKKNTDFFKQLKYFLQNAAYICMEKFKIIDYYMF